MSPCPKRKVDPPAREVVLVSTLVPGVLQHTGGFPHKSCKQAAKVRSLTTHGAFAPRYEVKLDAATPDSTFTDQGQPNPEQAIEGNSTPVAYVFAGRLRVEGGERHSLSQWLHHRSSGIERVEKQTKRSLACVPI